MQHGIFGDRLQGDAQRARGTATQHSSGVDPLERLRAEIIGHGTVPGAPLVLTEVVRLIDEDCDIHELAAVLQVEPGLTAKLLRAANSAFFGQQRGVASIQRAILVLGTSLVRSVSIGFAVWDTIAGGLPRPQVDALWQHAVAVAIASRHLAVATGGCDPDEAFTAGLLHDCGQLVLARSHGEASLQVRARAATGTPVNEAERAVIGVDHAVVGGWLLESWRLPASLVAAVRQHHADEPEAGLPALVAATSALARLDEMADDEIDARDGGARALAAACGVTADLWAEAASAVLADDVLRNLATA